jgi:uncharacterized caspase-like protein
LATKSALLIGISNYEDQRLASLVCPSSDVRALEEVLADPNLGGFDLVVSHINEQKSRVEKEITKLFRDRQHDDLVLLYFSGHGLRDDGGELYFAVRDTDHTDFDGTAIAANFVKRVMNKCSSRRQLVVLDCCHSGAFSAGFKGSKAEVIGSSVGTKAALDPDGFGRVILTASDSTQYAWEGDKIIGDAQVSLYTSFLIDGIRTGQADLNSDGLITVNELHDYAFHRTMENSSKQRPTIFSDRGQGAIILSRAPLKLQPLPREIEGALKSEIRGIRLAVINELVRIFRNDSPGRALSAYKEIAGLTYDDSLVIRSAASKAMELHGGTRTDLPQSLLEDLTKNLSTDEREEECARLEGFQSEVMQIEAEEADDRRSKSDIVARLKAEAEAAERLTAAEAQRKAEDEKVRSQAAAEAKRKAEADEAQRRAAAEAKRKAEADEAQRRAAAEAQRKAEDEKVRLQAAAEARRKAEADEAQRRAAAEAQRKAEDELSQQTSKTQLSRAVSAVGSIGAVIVALALIGLLGTVSYINGQVMASQVVGLPTGSQTSSTVINAIVVLVIGGVIGSLVGWIRRGAGSRTAAVVLIALCSIPFLFGFFSTGNSGSQGGASFWYAVEMIAVISIAALSG